VNPSAPPSFDEVRIDWDTILASKVRTVVSQKRGGRHEEEA
jgi:hypothetical protein